MTARSMLVIAAIAALGFAPAARAGAPAKLSIDDVRVRGREHVLLLRALDAEGHAAEGLERGLAVRFDDRDVTGLDVRSPFADRRAANVAVVVDGDLLQPDSRSSEAIDELFRTLASGLASGDRVRVISAGRTVQSRDWSAGELRAGATPVRALVQSGAPHLLDAIDDGLRGVADRNAGPGRALLVVTAGRDGGSRRKISELNVDALRHGGVTAVDVLVFGEGEDADVIRQLERMSTVTHGRVERGLPSSIAMATDVVALANRYEVKFDVPPSKGGADRHEVAVRWEQGGRALHDETSYTDDAVAEPAWWSSPVVWFVVLVGVLLVIALLWFLQPRQVALLVVQGGEEEGQWFEIFDLPMRIGAREDNDILLAGRTLSGVHCLLERDGRDVAVVDQGSEFGTFVNGERVTRRVLEDDDVIRLGEDVELAFEARG